MSIDFILFCITTIILYCCIWYNGYLCERDALAQVQAWHVQREREEIDVAQVKLYMDNQRKEKSGKIAICDRM